MQNISQVVNPIRQIYLNTPPLVWNYHMELLAGKIDELNFNTYEKSNFRQTIIRHANGERGAGALRTMNVFLRKALQSSWPISDTFFEGTPGQMDEEALKTAAAMVIQFEQVLNEQKAALPL